MQTCCVLALLSDIFLALPQRAAPQAGSGAVASSQLQESEGLSAAEMASWFSGAAALLGWLPATAQLIASTPGGPQSDDSLVVRLALQAWLLIRRATKAPSQLKLAPSAAEAEVTRLLTAVWHYASTACRAVHFVAQLSGVQLQALQDRAFCTPEVQHEMLLNGLFWLAKLADEFPAQAAAMADQMTR